MPNLQSPAPAAQGKIQPHTHRRTHSLTPDTSRTTSPLKKVWAENYFADEVSGGTNQSSIEESIPLPTATALTLRNNPPASNEVTTPSQQPRTHQRSLTQLLPSWNTRQNSQSPQRSADNSPTKEDLQFEYMASLTGGTRADRSRGGRSWFSNSSTDEVTGSEQNESDSKMADNGEPSPNQKLEGRGTLPILDSNSTPAKSAGSSVFNFFSPKNSAKPIQLPSDINHDEYLMLDIQSSLFPSGQIEFSPAAFKNLQINAERIILKLQTAYKLRTIQYNEMKVEKDTQEEELEVAGTRAQSLKLQLENMAKNSEHTANKVIEQDIIMEDLVNKLAEEKQARVEERDFHAAQMKARILHRTSCCSTTEEDLGIPSDTKAKWRKSASTDTSGDSDDDGASGWSEGVFSRPRSPTLTVSTVMTRDSARDTPDIPSSFGRIGALQKDAQYSSKPTIVVPAKPKPQPSAFRKMLGMGSSESSPTNACSNCNGQGASIAWDTVGVLRVENKELKSRIGELEAAVDGSLDIVNGHTSHGLKSQS